MAVGSAIVRRECFVDGPRAGRAGRHEKLGKMSVLGLPRLDRLKSETLLNRPSRARGSKMACFVDWAMEGQSRRAML